MNYLNHYTVTTKSYAEPPVDRAEALRYAYCRESTPEIDELLSECLRLAAPSLSYRVAYRSFPCQLISSDSADVSAVLLDLGFTKTPSISLRKHLDGCSEIILFSATVGHALDRLAARYERLSPSKASMLNAIGCERVEALCDLFEAEVRREAEENGKTTVTRFSPGYGDVPLSMQIDVANGLENFKGTGITLNASLLMAPSKSVTAIIGIKDHSGGSYESNSSIYKRTCHRV